MKKRNNLINGVVGLLTTAFLFGLFVLSIRGMEGSNRQIPNIGFGATTTSLLQGYPFPNTPPSEYAVLTPTLDSTMALAYPTANMTPYALWPTTTTPLPKPTFTPTLIPSPTVSPTPLPVQSVYDVLWLEQIPDEESSIIWIANPADIGNRRELLRLDQVIYDFGESPDGRYIAFRSSNSQGGFIYLYDLDTFHLTQLDQGGNLSGPIFWSFDSQNFTYSIVNKDQNSETGFVDTVEIYNVQNSAIISKVTLPAVRALELLGWSSDNSLLISLPVINSTELTYDISGINIDSGSISRKFSTPVQVHPPNLSNDGSKLLLIDQSQVKTISIIGDSSSSILQTGRDIQVLWSNKADELLIGKLESNESMLGVYSMNIAENSETKLSSLPMPGPGSWELLNLSPDNLWMAAWHYTKGLFWIYLPNPYLVPFPLSPAGHIVAFIGWTRR